jgi:hypothetical protein
LKGFGSVPFRASHTEMSKFSGPRDPRYNMVGNTIDGFSKFSLTRQLWKCVSSFASNEATSDHLTSLKTLIEKGADLNLQNYQGDDALHQAIALEADVQVVKMFIAEGARISSRDAKGRTPLFIALAKDRATTVQHLHLKGAYLTATDIKSQAFLDLSADQKERIANAVLLNMGDNVLKPENLAAIVNLGKDAEDACLRSTMSITRFYMLQDQNRDHRRIKRSVFNVLYEGHLEDDISRIGALSQDQIESSSVLFTWYHLPANNVSSMPPTMQTELLNEDR